MQHLSCVSDGIGQCLLPQTSSLATCDSTLGGLPNDLGILRSGAACANIFLTREYRKSLCDIFLPPHEERRMQLLRMARTSRRKNNFFVHNNNLVNSQIFGRVVKFGKCGIRISNRSHVFHSLSNFSSILSGSFLLSVKCK